MYWFWEPQPGHEGEWQIGEMTKRKQNWIPAEEERMRISRGHWWEKYLGFEEKHRPWQVHVLLSTEAWMRKTERRHKARNGGDKRLGGNTWLVQSKGTPRKRRRFAPFTTAHNEPRRHCSARCLFETSIKGCSRFLYISHPSHLIRFLNFLKSKSTLGKFQ